jgi:crotonobetainyl-CoA:carnitine CoA-transferase CaiB-like acyl-CoA transferase
VKPLEGLRVIDLTQAMAAPFCTMNLADMGADVIKVEAPGEGESMRQLGRAQKNGHSGTFMTMNRNKRSLAVDLKQPEGVEILRRLAKTADVFVQNYRPGVAERLGVGYDALRAVNPRLVYCAISGFGQTGPYAMRGGYDLIAQGMSGVMSVTGEEGGPPAKSGVPLADLAAGLFGAYGILCALEHRERTGEGQLVDTSLLEAAMALTIGEPAPYRVLRASDGYFTFDAQVKGTVAAAIEAHSLEDTRAAWVTRLEEAGVPAGPVNDYAEALADPHALARGMVVELVHPGAGDIKALGVPVKLSDTPGAVERAAPLLGQHRDEILKELCYAESEVQALRSKGVIQ